LKLFRLTETQELIAVGDSTDPAFASLIAQPIGEGVTVSDAISVGQCAFVSGQWVIPEVVTVLGGEAQAETLAWSRTDAEHAQQSEHVITARVGEDIVKQSQHIQLIRGHQQVAPSDLDIPVETTRGIMSRRDLVARIPVPGTREYWLPSANPPSNPLDVVETETLADGTIRFLERVHRSAIALPH
jgi:hypothetical protein